MGTVHSLMKREAVMVILETEGRYLFGKRNLAKASGPGYWCPISGKIERGESQSDAVAREAFEEVGLDVIPLRKIGEMKTNDGSTLLHWWTAEIVAGVASLRNDEHTELRWVTVDEMRELTPAFSEDIEFIVQYATATPPADLNLVD